MTPWGKLGFIFAIVLPELSLPSCLMSFPFAPNNEFSLNPAIAFPSFFFFGCAFCLVIPLFFSYSFVCSRSKTPPLPKRWNLISLLLFVFFLVDFRLVPCHPFFPLGKTPLLPPPIPNCPSSFVVRSFTPFLLPRR